jgi:CBS domain-containing protein
MKGQTSSKEQPYTKSCTVAARINEKVRNGNFIRNAIAMRVMKMPTIKEIMTKNIITLDVNKSVVEAAELMSSNGISCLVIVDGETPVGIITERDMVRKIVAKKISPDIKVSEIMSKNLITVDPDASLKDAARLMSQNRIRRLPVLKQNKLVGIVVASDFVRNAGKKTTNEEILEAMGRYPIGPVP